MSLWTTFRTAINLAARIEELEAQFAALSSEWADVLDMLRKREERQRKRDARAVKELVSEPTPKATESPTDPKEQKERIRKMILLKHQERA